MNDLRRPCCTRGDAPLGRRRKRLTRRESESGRGSSGFQPRLHEYPEVWQRVGDLSALAERAWIAVLASDHPLAVESMKRTVEEMKADLAGDHPTRLERLLVDQVVGCWMEVKYVESVSADPGRGTLEQAAFRLKRLESAQRRFDNAVKSLSTLRTLMPAGLAPAQSIKLHEPKEHVG